MHRSSSARPRLHASLAAEARAGSAETPSAVTSANSVKATQLVSGLPMASVRMVSRSFMREIPQSAMSSRTWSQ